MRPSGMGVLLSLRGIDWSDQCWAQPLNTGRGQEGMHRESGGHDGGKTLTSV